MSELELTRIPPGPERERLIPLLLLADDSEPEVRSYFQRGDLFELKRDDVTVGATLVLFEQGHAELKAVAVDSGFHGQGLGQRMLRLVLDALGARGVSRVVVGTASSGIGQLAFYQKVGFRFERIERDFFSETKGYPPGLEENGLPVRDMVWMDMEL